MKNKGYRYSFNVLSREQKTDWNMSHTLVEVKENRQLIIHKALEGIPQDELLLWILVDQPGIIGNALHDVYIAFRISSWLPPKGRTRSIYRTLKMLGVPFTNVTLGNQGYEPADADLWNSFPVVVIRELKTFQ